MKAALLALAVALLPAAAQPRLAGCPLFPPTNAWNQRVDRLPVAAGSATIVASIGPAKAVHADFGSGLYERKRIGIPFNVVTRKTKRSRITFDYDGESDHVGHPIPRGVHLEGGGDRHALLLDRDACRLYELGGLERRGGRWHAWAGATWSLRSNRLRPAGWTSADAAGLPILPGLARYDEVRAGAIRHALRFTVSRTRRAYVYPARHYASDRKDPSLPPMGLRLRLRAGFDTRSFPRQSRIVLEALKRYGMIVADNGSDWYVSGAPDRRWSNDDLHALGRVKGGDFEVVDTSSLPKPS